MMPPHSCRHGLVGLTKAPLEYAQAGVRINVVYPGFIHTLMVERAFDLLSRDNPHVATQGAALHPVGRPGTP